MYSTYKLQLRTPQKKSYSYEKIEYDEKKETKIKFILIKFQNLSTPSNSDYLHSRLICFKSNISIFDH